MKRGLFILFSFCAISNAYAAADCLQRPSCEELGYDQTKIMCGCFKKDMNEDILPCPFNIKDENTVFCGDLDYADLSDSVMLTDNVDELVAQGYTKVTKSTTVSEFEKLLGTAGSKIVLAEDVSFNTYFSFWNNNLTINGGGHLLKIKGLRVLGNQLTIENIKVENFLGGDYGRELIYSSSSKIIIRNVRIMDNNNIGICVGIRLESSDSIVENVSIDMSSQDAEELWAIWADSAYTDSMKNVRINLDGGADTILVGIVASAKDKSTHKVSIANVGMIASGGKNIYGVVGGVDGVKTTPVGGVEIRPDGLYNGQANTKAIVAQLGEKGLAAYAATQFYVGDKDGDFGQGKWYLPSIGEWMELYGTDVNKIVSGFGSSGAKGDTKNLINNALTVLADKGAEAEILKQQLYWTSSEGSKINPLTFSIWGGTRSQINKLENFLAVRCLHKIKGNFLGGVLPQVGNVMYEDKTYGKAADYDGSKKAVGIVAIVSKDDVTVINLKDLTFNSQTAVNNFNPDNPYASLKATTLWCTEDKRNEDILDVENFSRVKLLITANPNALVVTVNGLKKSFTEPCD